MHDMLNKIGTRAILHGWPRGTIHKLLHHAFNVSMHGDCEDDLECFIHFTWNMVLVFTETA